MDRIDSILQKSLKKFPKFSSTLTALAQETKLEIMKLEFKRNDLKDHLFLWELNIEHSLTDSEKNLKLKDLTW
jgi:hypothetical protein